MSKSCQKNIHGILLVHKPEGLTSNRVLQQVKHLYGARKAGHTGSLDPLATGMLPICFGEATKFSQYLLDADKAYAVTGLLGIKTNTGDATGEVIERQDTFQITEEMLQETLKKFTGVISQVPSMFSALKHQGTPLYKFARQGIEVIRPSRQIMIHQLELNHFDGRFMEMTVTCSKGTYIRNLVEDIGTHLGVGAHVTKLHRIYTAGFMSDKMYTVDELVNLSQAQRLEALLPMESAISSLPKVELNVCEADALRHGKEVQINGFDVRGCVRLYESGHSFLGLGELQASGLLKVKRLLAQNCT